MIWKNIVQPDRPQMTVQYGACALRAGYLRLIDPQSVYVTLITFPHDLWLRERALVLRLYVHCLSRDVITGRISATYLSESNIQ
jgi:hypothetical protein